MKKVILALIMISLLFMINNSISSIHTLLTNEQSLSSLTTTLENQKKEHDFLKQRLYFVQTNDFVEQEARNKLGLVKPGEHIVIAPLPEKEKLIQWVTPKENWQKWMNLFF